MRPTPVCSAGDGDIFDSIQRGNTEHCAQFVQNDPSVLQRKGWGGFTPLHYAALHGNRTLIDLFLNNGANPNSTCDAGQTAFHFSCRQGNIYIMHQMMKHGADLRLVDLQGKTSLHHAVSGGNIVAVQYLWETGIFRFSDKDLYKVTPLHLAASTGNTEMVQYLLRDQRCSVDAADQQGVTALHIAAERGGVEVCWMLLQTAGCWILHQKNHSGLTPLDLCKQGKTFRHQQLTRLLKQYITEPIHHKPRESHVLYYWTLLFPTLSGTVILLIAAMLGAYGGLLCGLLFPWLARSIFTQYHRMTTYQRLPNPIYLGTLMAGMFLSILCFYGKILSSVLPSALVQVSMVHFALVLCLFCKVLTQDPGKLDRAEADPRFSCIAELVENNQSPHRFCPYCELFQPDYTKHCKLCDVCIKDYDHHCLFLNQCIGRGNHRLFLSFILSMLGAHLLFLASATRYLYEMTSTDSYSYSWSLWLSMLGTEFWVVAMMVMNALTLLWEMWLLNEQFGAIATGTTTYFKQCDDSTRHRLLGQRWITVLLFLFEGQRRVGIGGTEDDRKSIDI
ncbi:probable protein S-acyltransferase 23 [Thalassophryne amazonica]|uniref:probable protein S-acyltransferase 23 n=1 Tax=Thalassophryne amazonica TaxID=390379 RepID=UPI0014721109|nr:probable protein S-acyltransferase 23 [Thalassophryne amazonica]